MLAVDSQEPRPIPPFVQSFHFPVILQPENLFCEVCQAAARVEVLVASTDAKHAYCDDHYDAPATFVSGDCRVVRSRLLANCAVNRAMAAPESSEEHQRLRRDLCETRHLGELGACRYYLSISTGSNQFTLWSDEFERNAREFVLAETSGAAEFVKQIESWALYLAVPLFKAAYLKVRTGEMPRLSRPEEAVIALLRHPDCSDEQIAERIGTTVKQLRRNGNYSGLRTGMKRAELQ
ncbi:hypothetical protein [Blastopirellula marina]|uniref:Uncharacterized protein n=1 Tax=Blastopirellula marina TaxID=124 RepID=A0A2S8GGN8_9BACT|nr:hypothetical protein [Blastopirellula marina]PQO43632.1 hypothetical protein C5Y93_23615 [Blastopirellula marina]